MFQEGKVKAGDKKAVKYEFFEKYVISEKLVADYIEHLTDIEIEKIGEQIMAGSVQKESNKNTMTLTRKISITETSCHPLE